MVPLCGKCILWLAEPCGLFRGRRPPGRRNEKRDGTFRRAFSCVGAVRYFAPKSRSRSEKLSYSLRSDAISSLTVWILSARQALAPQKA